MAFGRPPGQSNDDSIASIHHVANPRRSNVEVIDFSVDGKYTKPYLETCNIQQLFSIPCVTFNLLPFPNVLLDPQPDTPDSCATPGTQIHMRSLSSTEAVMDWLESELGQELDAQV